MLQACKSLVRFPMGSLDFSIYLILPAALMVLGSTQSVAENSTRNLPRGKGLNADNFNVICEPNV
jgi:hypothetical protein